METPEHERRAIEEYLRSQSGPDFVIEHVEKLTSEYVLGHQYDVWDAHTNEGRWWVITPFTNLYSQDHIRSMDIALSFHIGLMSRVMARDSVRFKEGGTKTWVLEVLRRLEVASDNLERAKEVEDVQAVGMRLRETLLTLIDKLHDLRLEMPEHVDLPQQDGNFKGWAEIYSGILAPGPSSGRLRKLLKSQSDCTWEYLGWLTHARNASILDGRVAWSVTNELIETFLFAVARIEYGSTERCPVCSSYQLSRQRTDGGDWIRQCFTCGWSGPTNAPAPINSEYEAPSEEPKDVEGECITAEGFAVYLTPGQARNMLEEAAAAFAEEDEQPGWTNPFAFRFPEDDSIHDAHRLVFRSFNHEPAPGSELTYECEEDSCVNPKHAKEMPLHTASNWSPMLVERVVSRPSYLELQVANQAKGRISLFTKRETLSRYGMGDASSLLERVIFISEADGKGWVSVIPAARRADYKQGSAVPGWIHPSHPVSGDDACPCGSGITYAACHGQSSEDQGAAS